MNRVSNIILLRVEASKSKGMGHLIRCLNLFACFPKSFMLHILLKKMEGQEAVLEYIKSLDYSYSLLDKNINWIEDAKQTVLLLKKLRANLLITDLCHWDMLQQEELLYLYHQKIKQIAPESLFIFSIEDSRLKSFASDLVLLPNPISDELPMDYEFDANTKLIYGNEYYISNPSFSKIDFRSRQIKKVAKNILISIGGGDPYKVTNKIIEILAKENLESLNVKIIVGISRSVQEQELFESVSKENTSIEILYFTNEMARLFLWADIAIVGEGNIKFEAALTGTPSLLITQFDHSSKPITYYIEKETAIYVGKAEVLKAESFISSLQNLINDFEQRKKMSKNGLVTFTNKGAEQIYTKYLEQILQNLYEL